MQHLTVSQSHICFTSALSVLAVLHQGRGERLWCGSSGERKLCERGRHSGGGGQTHAENGRTSNLHVGRIQ